MLGGAEAEARVAVLDHERGDPVRALVRVGHRHHRVVLRHPGVGDPPLHAVEQVAAVRPDRPGAHRGGVRAGLRLGQRVGEHPLAARDQRQVALLDLLGRAEQQRHRAELVHRRDQRGRRAGAGDLLDDERRGERVAAGPAVGLGDVHRVEVGLHQRLVHVPGELGGPVDVRRPRRDLVIRERAHRFAQCLVLFRQCEGAHAPMLTSAPKTDVTGRSTARPHTRTRSVRRRHSGARHVELSAACAVTAARRPGRRCRRVRAGQARHRGRVGRPVRVSQARRRGRGSGTQPFGAACLPLDRYRPSERNGRLLDTEKAIGTSPLTQSAQRAQSPHQTLATGPVPAACAGSRMPHRRRRKHP